VRHNLHSREMVEVALNACTTPGRQGRWPAWCCNLTSQAGAARCKGGGGGSDAWEAGAPRGRQAAKAIAGGGDQRVVRSGWERMWSRFLGR
jgi:hypothetical protein